MTTVLSFSALRFAADVTGSVTGETQNSVEDAQTVLGKQMRSLVCGSQIEMR
jgi:hypothetical protein